MHFIERVLRNASAMAALAAVATGAHAGLVPLGGETFSGTGLGAVNTVLTISSPGSSTFESGAVGFGNVITGDALTGASQTHTRTLGELGVTSASTLRVVFNALEPGNAEANGITLEHLMLNIYSPTGTLLFSSGDITPVTFSSTFTGTGNAGFVFGLDAAQQAAAAAAFGAGFQNNVVTLSAAAGCGVEAPAGCLGATGGFETFFVANAAAVAAVPEPSTYALMVAGLAAMGLTLLRRRSS